MKNKDDTNNALLESLNTESATDNYENQKNLFKDDVPEISDRIFIIFSFFTGVATLFTFNSVMCMSSYWVEKFGPDIPNKMGFYVQFCGLIGD